jgi:hypothetical protein
MVFCINPQRAVNGDIENHIILAVKKFSSVNVAGFYFNELQKNYIFQLQVFDYIGGGRCIQDVNDVCSLAIELEI